MSPLVLIVEEQPVMRGRYERYLRSEGYEVVTTAGVEDVVPLASEVSPNVIVIDPDGDGGKGYDTALALLRSGLDTQLVFNISHPFDLGSDFTSWVADDYAVRTHSVGELGRAVRRVMPERVRKTAL